MKRGKKLFNFSTQIDFFFTFCQIILSKRRLSKMTAKHSDSIVCLEQWRENCSFNRGGDEIIAFVERSLL